MVAAKPIVSVLVHDGSNEQLADLASAIHRKHQRRLFVAELAEEPTQPAIEMGLVPCDACGVCVSRRDGHYQVHFPDGKTSTPCPRSWPPKASR
jgi:hypothetical protein